ncbi:MAG: hypothetical protein AB8C84_06110 [Oligoflexales bacterium]
MRVFFIAVCFFLVKCGAQPGTVEDSNQVKIPNVRGSIVPSSVFCNQSPNDTYEHFAKGFFLNYCQDCHSSYWSGDERFGAPVLVNFDTHREIMIYRAKILEQLNQSPRAMPPGRDIEKDDIARILVWLQCGAPE